MTDDRHDRPGGAAPLLDSTFALIQRVRAGDREALNRLMARHVGPLRRWISGRLPLSACPFASGAQQGEL